MDKIFYRAVVTINKSINAGYTGVGALLMVLSDSDKLLIDTSGCVITVSNDRCRDALVHMCRLLNAQYEATPQMTQQAVTDMFMLEFELLSLGVV